MKKQIILIILLALNLFVNAQYNKDIKSTTIIWEYWDEFELSVYYDEYVGYIKKLF